MTGLPSGYISYASSKINPIQLLVANTGYGNSTHDNIAVYSFALKPEEHQPSGTCNFSRIDDVRLEIKSLGGGPDFDMHIYAVNYNVLRIMSGMGGLAYSN